MLLSMKKTLIMLSLRRPVRILTSRVYQLAKKFCSDSQTIMSFESVDFNYLKHLNDDIRSGGVVPVFRRALLFPSRIALQDEFGIYTYGGLYQSSVKLSELINDQLKGETRQTIAYLCGLDASHIITQWAIWMSGNIAVPLSPLHPPPMLKYFVEDSEAKLLISSQENLDVLRPIAKELNRQLLISSRDLEITAQLNQEDDHLDPEQGQTNQWYSNADALFIYTSGTTSKPKGVVWSHAAWLHQIASLHMAWGYQASDVVLHILPLHHIHGQLNSLNASLAAGSRIRMIKNAKPHRLWARFLSVGEQDEASVNVFHAVPTVYAKLIDEHSRLFTSTTRTAEYVRSTLASKFRLMTCGSAPLPAPLFAKWEEISGHRLLERYGMSEIGMALSNPYTPMSDRTQSTVGIPLPGVEARIVSTQPDGTLQPLITVSSQAPSEVIELADYGFTNRKVKDLFTDQPKVTKWKNPSVEIHLQSKDNTYSGDLLIRGKGIFKHYYKRETEDILDNGWFRTGDTVSYNDEKFSIMGRTSVDIIKTGGYKVSALHIESILLEHPNISDVGVVGLPDEIWGERVAALIVLNQGSELIDFKDWAKQRLASYQVPSVVKYIDEMPRNVMGKLDKKVIVTMFDKK